MHSQNNPPLFQNKGDDATILPFITDSAANESRTDEEKIELIAEHFHEIMEILGLDMADPSLAKTPQRIAKMYINEIFSGMCEKNFPKLSFFDYECDENPENENMVFVKATFFSFCEHHFVPMPGTAFVAYLPNKKLIGLSKIPRIVRFFAKRPQLQERLNKQIVKALESILETEHIAVTIKAQHFCVMARGIEDSASHTVTNVLQGKFKSDEMLRREFFEAVNRQ